MGPRYIIDGYNLLFRIFPQATFSDLEGKRRLLISALNTIAKLFSYDIMLLFDGTHGGHIEVMKSHIGEIEVLFSPKGMTVDQLVLNANSDFFTHAKLVTSDERLSRMMGLKGVRSISGESFLKTMRLRLKKLEREEPSLFDQPQQRSSAPSNLPSLGDAQRWIELFETGDQRNT